MFLSSPSRFVLACAVTLLGAAGCVPEETGCYIEAPPWAVDQGDTADAKPRVLEGYLTVEGRGHEFNQFRVTRNGIWNQEMAIERDQSDPHTFRGVVWGAGITGTNSIEMTAAGDVIEGSRNGQVIDMRLEHRASNVLVTGRYGGGYAHFTMRHEEGAYCAYRDAATPDDEAPSCANNRYALQVPPSMAAMPESEQAAMLLAAFYQ
jgi:hypothetical protein